MKMQAYYQWREYCAAAERLCARFGAETALDYLVADKFRSHLRRAEKDAGFALTLPEFAKRIRQMFEPDVLREFLDTVRGAPPARRTIDRKSLRVIRTMLEGAERAGGLSNLSAIAC